MRNIGALRTAPIDGFGVNRRTVAAYQE